VVGECVSFFDGTSCLRSVRRPERRRRCRDLFKALGDSAQGDSAVLHTLLCLCVTSERQVVPWGLVTSKIVPCLILNSVAESASKPYRPSDHRLSEKLMSTFADRGCHVVSEIPMAVFSVFYTGAATFSFK
jgi:hypothetical protein